MNQVIFRREARADVFEAHRWYEAQEPGLGRQFRAELRATIERVRKQPRAYRILHRETRRARLERFPYGVFYREYPDAVVVVAVLHSSRHPRRWKLR